MSAVSLIEKGDLYCAVLRHVDIRLKWIVYQSLAGTFRVIHVKGIKNASDIMTKVLGYVKHLQLCDLMGMVLLVEGNAESGLWSFVLLHS